MTKKNSWLGRPTEVNAPNSPSEPIPLARDAAGVAVKLRSFPPIRLAMALVALVVLVSLVLVLTRDSPGTQIVVTIVTVMAVARAVARWWNGRRGHCVRVSRDARHVRVEGPAVHGEWSFDEIRDFRVHQVGRRHPTYELALERVDGGRITIPTALSRQDVAWVAAQLRAAMASGPAS